MNDFKVKIDLAKPAGSIGFGVPLILEAGATTDIAYKECSSLAEVISAGYANTTAVYKAAELMFMQDNAPAKIAVCATSKAAKEWLGDIDNTSKDWRQLVIVGLEASNVSDVAATIETLEDKMLFVSLAVDDSTVTGLSYDQTVLFYCTDTKYEDCAAALVGATAGLTVGSFTYKNIILKGIAPQNLTASEVNAIHAKNGITFVTKAGDNVTSEGIATSGEYVDIIDSKDWIVQQIAYRSQKLLNTMKKVPYDDNGITMLENVCITVLKEAANMGMIAYDKATGSYLYSTNYALYEETTAEDRAVRKYIGGKFSFKLAGAIHGGDVNGEVEV